MTTDQPVDVITLDTLHMGRPQVIATYLLTGSEPALVDPGPASTLPAIEAALADHGLALDDICHVVLTHIHLDHAAATGQIAARHPDLRVWVHTRGAPHLIDPSRLLDSAVRLYGEMMGPLWGEILPVPADHVTVLHGGEQFTIGDRTLRAYDAPGHAKHHLIYLDERSGTAFVGDNCGVRLPNVAYARPATPPPDIDLEQWLATLDLLGELQPAWLALTHFGAYHDVTFHLADYRARLQRWAEAVRTGLHAGGDLAAQQAPLAAVIAEEMTRLNPDEQALIRAQGGDVGVNFTGLARYWQKKMPTVGS
jgi:glyoxylase-like metal-dependent hydrolase (beta-lactamase superfamily II)